MVQKTRYDVTVIVTHNKHATVEELLETVFFIRPTWGYTASCRRHFQWVTRVEAGSNTSAVALRVVGRAEKETQCLGVKLDHPVPGGYKYGALQIEGISNLRQ
jgi:hypothetical protein